VSKVAAVGLIVLLAGCATSPQLIAYTPRQDIGRVVREIRGCYAHYPATDIGWWDLACLAAAGYRVEIYDPAAI
jgi:hypothetical protein